MPELVRPERPAPQADTSQRAAVAFAIALIAAPLAIPICLVAPYVYMSYWRFPFEIAFERQLVQGLVNVGDRVSLDAAVKKHFGRPWQRVCVGDEYSLGLEIGIPTPMLQFYIERGRYLVFRGGASYFLARFDSAWPDGLGECYDGPGLQVERLRSEGKMLVFKLTSS